MCEQMVKTYTIGPHALPSNDFTTHHVELPPNSSNVKIIITEPTLIEGDKTPRLPAAKPNANLSAAPPLDSSVNTDNGYSALCESRASTENCC